MTWKWWMNFGATLAVSALWIVLPSPIKMLQEFYHRGEWDTGPVPNPLYAMPKDHD